MIGTYIKKKFDLYDAVKVIEADDEIRKLLFKLSFILGKGKSIYVLRDHFMEKDNLTDEDENFIYKYVESNLDNPLYEIVEKIQARLQIETNFFLYSIEDNNIYVFDVNYKSVLNSKYKISVDYTKLAVISNKDEEIF